MILLFSSISFAQPELEIVGNSFDFGVTPQNSDVSQHFWFKSVGDDTLKITEIKTGCKCVLMPLERTSLAPGDSMYVGLEWKISRHLYKAGKYPYIYTNASPDPYRIYLTAEVYQSLDSTIPLSMSPYKFELSKFKGTDKSKIKFTVTNRTESDLTLQIVSSQVDECEISFPKVIKAKSSENGYVKVKDEYLDKEFNGSITFMANDKDQTKYTLPYRRKIFKAN